MASAVRTTLKKVEEIYKEYAGLADTKLLPINIEVLTEIASRISKIPITCSKKEWPGLQIKGRLLRYKDKALIEYSKQLPLPWERFVVTKELCHLMMDTNKDFTTDVAGLVEDLVAGGMPRSEAPTAAETSERMCMLAALELLFPFSIRRDIHKAYKDEGMSALTIADHFKIPTHFVENLLGDKHRDTIDTIHYEVREENECAIASSARAVDNKATAALHNGDK